MAFVRTRIVGGHMYMSLEERYRDPVTKKVKSRYLKSLTVPKRDEYDERMGRVLANCQREAEKKEKEQREMFGETAAERTAREKVENTWTQEKFLQETSKEIPTATRDGDAPQTTDGTGGAGGSVPSS